MRLMYVFDYMVAGDDDYVVRVPELVARFVVSVAWRFGRTWDYAPTPAGF